MYVDSSLIEVNIHISILEFQAIKLIAFKRDFSLAPFSQERIHFVPPVIKVSVVYTEVAEDLYFLRFQSQFRVAKDNEIVVVGHCFLLVQHLVDVFVPDADEETVTCTAA
jgi:hypothetical protein